MKHLQTFESFVETSILEKMSVDDFAKEWDAMYGENFKEDYYDVRTTLDKLKSFDLAAVKKAWRDSYGEDFEKEYKGLYDTLAKKYGK